MKETTMRSFTVTQLSQPLEVLEQPIPEPRGTEVLLRVTAAGLCHSDLHLWEGYYDMGSGKRLNMADRGIKPPMVLSHEICGEIVSAGPDAEAVRVGARVLAHPWIGCNECDFCKRGEENICPKGCSLGVHRPGGFADYVIVPHPRYLIDIAGLDEADVAPLACAGVTTYSAISKLGNRIHEGPAAIIGAGGLGHTALKILQALGAKGAIFVDIDPVKREAVLAAGALAAIDGKADDVVKQVFKATNGGARAVLDLVGTSQTVNLGMAATARGGHIVICGLIGGEITISVPLIPMKPLTIQGSYVGTLKELRELVDLVRRSKMASIPVTRRPLIEINAAMQDLAQGKVIGRTVMIP
jgi:D-arabinose 1-dehydrogenase-like Zn-dependent alcohol dehydrogenase